MKRSLMGGVLAIVALCLPFTSRAFAHPGSGIVIDDKGRVFFQGGRAVWMIDASGRLTKYYDKLGGHWMALDADGSFARADLKLVERITPSGAKPALIVADGGAPVAVGRDGNLYYALRLLDGGSVECGVTRISPDGKQSRFAPDLEQVVKKHDGITGLATGRDESLYVACPSAILKVKMDGTFTTLVSPVVVKDCDEELPPKDGNPSPYLRGIAVDSRGTVYAAANGCHCVVKITPEGKVETVLKAERSWSPTGVAVFGEDVYVLEYTNSLQGSNEGEGWQPRVRKLGRDGKVTTLATVARDEKKPKAAERTLTIRLDGGTTFELVRIEPGRFQMGSPASDKLADEAEKPQREVRIEKGFYFGRTTVTFGQFQEFVLDTGYRTDAEVEPRPKWRGGHGFNADRNTFEGWFPQYTWRNPGWPQTDDHPVGNVSWNDAAKFCEWLSKKSGKSVRLPTEAEWEYACRAGTTTVFFTGDEPASLKGYANVPDEALRTKLGRAADAKVWFPFDDGYPFTAPVGRFKPNPWGLHDMTGNVFQWCGDEFPDGDAKRRVLRGGSYNLNIQTCRCAYRGFGKPESRYSYTGFRVVVTP